MREVGGGPRGRFLHNHPSTYGGRHKFRRIPQRSPCRFRPSTGQRGGRACSRHVGGRQGDRSHRHRAWSHQCTWGGQCRQSRWEIGTSHHHTARKESVSVDGGGGREGGGKDLLSWRTGREHLAISRGLGAVPVPAAEVVTSGSIAIECWWK